MSSHEANPGPDDPAEALRARRQALFRERPVETLERVLLGTAWALKPDRISALPRT